MQLFLECIALQCSPGEVVEVSRRQKDEYGNQLPRDCQVQGNWLIEQHISNQRMLMIANLQWKIYMQVKDRLNAVDKFVNMQYV